MKKTFLLLGLCCMVYHTLYADKQVYISNQMKREGYSQTSNETMWSDLRSKQSENFIVFWQPGFGNNPSTKTWSESIKTVDVYYLLNQLERFYAHYADSLKFIDTSNATAYSSRYKMIVNLYFTSDWMAYGGGSDNIIGNMWISPATCQPIGSTIAHECGHCFQAQAGYDGGVLAGFNYPIGSGCTFWEQTSEWQSFQFYPEERFNAHMPLFLERHNLAFTHEYMRYQSVWLHHYWTEKHGADLIGRMWRGATAYGQDINEVYMANMGMSIDDFYAEMYDAYSRAATFDLDITREYGANWIGKYEYNCTDLLNGYYQVTYKSCPQATGFNVIPLKVPQAGEEISINFIPLAPESELVEGDPGICNDYSELSADIKKKVSQYNSFSNGKRENVGFCLGYVALLKDNTRIYGEMTRLKDGDNIVNKPHELKFTVPEKTSRLYFIVTPAPHADGEGLYCRHQWDDNDNVKDDQWPYRFSINGTSLDTRANVYTNPHQLNTAKALYINGQEVTGFTNETTQYTYSVNPCSDWKDTRIQLELRDNYEGKTEVVMPETLPGVAEIKVLNTYDVQDATYYVLLEENFLYNWDGRLAVGAGSEPTVFGWSCDDDNILTDVVNGKDSTFHYMDDGHYTGYTLQGNEYTTYRLMAMPFFNSETYQIPIEGMKAGHTYQFSYNVAQSIAGKKGVAYLRTVLTNANGEELFNERKYVYRFIPKALLVHTIEFDIPQGVSTEGATLSFSLEENPDGSNITLGELRMTDKGECTAIEHIQADKTNSAIYNIWGQQAKDMIPGNIYIINGKKMICK